MSSLIEMLLPWAIIAITASVLEEQKAVILSSGCDDFVRKPFQEKVIFEIIAKYLEVRYVYENNSLTSPDFNFPNEPFDIRDFMIDMPQEWIIQLHSAALEADSEWVNKMIDEISEIHKPTLQIIKNWVNNFEFEKILDLTESFLDS